MAFLSLLSSLFIVHPPCDNSAQVFKPFLGGPLPLHRRQHKNSTEAVRTEKGDVHWREGV